MNFNIHSPEYALIDSDAMDLLEKMLKVNPTERITTAEMLRHPFLASEMIMDEEKPVTPVTRLTNMVKNKLNFSNGESAMMEKNFL